MTKEQKRKQVTAMFGAYSKRLERLYDKFLQKLSLLAKRIGVDTTDFLKKDGLFRFDKYPELGQDFNRIFTDYVQENVLAYRAGITDGVALAYSHQDSVLTGFSILSDNAITHARNIAATTFIRSRLKTARGLSLSHLIWNYAQQAKSEFEVAVSNVIADGLKRGTSAADLGRQVRQYLNNPDMMYRRYHRTVVDAMGGNKDIVKWRKRVVDEQGRVRFVEEPLEKVGMGHYRSSRRNSERLMRTEINMAYHRANSERWQKEPFVIGIEIELSPQHPVYDECDELAGRYPKDFLFIGWHPQCLCMSNPITIQGEEKKEFYRRLAAGEDMSNYVSPYAVKDIPGRAKQWIDENREKFIRAGERGKLGYVWRENTKYWKGQFSLKEQQKMGIYLYNDLSRKILSSLTPREKTALIVVEPFSSVIAEKLLVYKDAWHKATLFKEVMDDGRASILNITDKGFKTIVFEGHKGKQHDTWKATKNMAFDLNLYGKSVAFLPELDGVTSADAFLKFKKRPTIADFKYCITTNVNSLSETLIEGYRQAGCIVLKLANMKEHGFIDSIDYLRRNRETIGNLILMNNHGGMVEIERMELKSGSYKKKIKGFLF